MIPLEGKKRLIDALLASGLTRIEMTSFVSPKWIPQLADAEELARAIVPPPGVTFSALCPERPRPRARARRGLREIAVFLSASETHNRMNVNKTIDETLAVSRRSSRPRERPGSRVRAYVSTVWGCPTRATSIPRGRSRSPSGCSTLGCYQDLPRRHDRRRDAAADAGHRRALSRRDAGGKFALHLHDTRGTALANALVGLEMGVRDFDASVAGVGGCPYAPGRRG